MDKTTRIRDYAGSYLADYGFEAVMVAARRRLAIEVLAARRPASVLEAGCGADLLALAAAEAGHGFTRWVAIEPSDTFVALAREKAAGEPRFSVVPGFFEDAAPDIVAESGKFDLILVAGLLGEVEDPGAILAAAREAVAPGGIIHVNVPNAYSLHRRLARAMGLIADEHAMSDRNRALAQHRNYDAASLRRDVEAAGLRVVEDGGYFLKPFTHAQMENLGDLLTEQMLDGLWQMGREMPDLASEIYVNAVPA
jgi:SAM-dependent methyltransferase